MYAQQDAALLLRNAHTPRGDGDGDGEGGMKGRGEKGRDGGYMCLCVHVEGGLFMLGIQRSSLIHVW